MQDYQILTEKYRPNKLDQIIGQDNIVKRLHRYVETKNMPNLLFAGKPGISKTTAAVCIAKELYGNSWLLNFLELNASDSRGIDVIRERVKSYASIKSVGEITFKIILLDEADALTKDAQNALKRTMETYSSSCRFILTCNLSSKIIEPISSRTSIFRFKQIKNEDIIKICKNICEKENIKIEFEALEAIAFMSEGDARKAIGTLDSSMITSESKSITLKDIYEVTSFIEPKIIIDIIKKALSNEFFASLTIMENLIINDGISSDDIIKQLMKRALELNIPNKMVIVELVDIIGETDWRISEGANELIMLKQMIARMVKLGSII